MTESDSSGKYMVAYTDASCRPSPGFGGYGVFGYLYTPSAKPKNNKHPVKANLVFTDKGIEKERSGACIEVTDIIEVIHAVDNHQCTSNELELKAALSIFHRAYEIEDLREVTILTDSNYVVQIFNTQLEKWVANGWKRQDGKGIAHLTEWTTIESYRHHFASKGVKIQIVWVKGHSDSYGNIIADLYSVVGSNASRVQREAGATNFNNDILNRVTPYAEFKQSYMNKDFIYYFRDMFFRSDFIDDNNYCFIGTTEDDREIGKRNNTTIFAMNVGYVPPIVNQIKHFYRSLTRNYVATCSMRLSKFENRDILRIAALVDIRYLLMKTGADYDHRYELVDGSGIFLQENTLEFPFIANVSRVAKAIADVRLRPEDDHLLTYDVTNDFVQDGKLVLGNKDKFVDFTSLASDKIVFKQKLLANVGYDTPSYLALKRIEADVCKCEIILQRAHESNFYTLYTKITTKDREIYSMNVLNKYLAVHR